MNQKFDIKISLVILSTDIPNNKKYVLSTSDSDIVLPSFDINNNNYNNIRNTIFDFIKDRMVVSPLELMPSLITVDQNDIPEILKNKDIFNIIFGSVITFNTNINNLYWQEFSLLIPNQYSNLIFQVIHSLS